MRKTPISILYIDTHDHETCLEKFAGARRFSNTVGWKITRVKVPRHGRTIDRILMRHKPDGCIVNATRLLGAIPPRSFGRTPVVYLDTDAARFRLDETVVAHDSIGTGRLAAQELLKLKLRRYYYAPYRQKAFWSDLRQRGFRDLLADAGREAATLDISSAACDDLRQSGIFTANDEVATVLLARLKTLGLRVPDDVAVISADDTDDSEERDITSIRIDFERSGYLSAQALAGLIKQRPQPTRIHFGDVCIRHRGSTHHFSRCVTKIPAAIALIREHAKTGLTVADVVGLLGCSRRKAELDFKTATGKSILEEIQNVRLEHACTLLTQGIQSISSIVDFCGYKTPQAMRKAFRLYTGMSMFEWRKRLAARKGPLPLSKRRP